jgi:RNA polymerase sigma factor (sigma-70 family)
MKTKILTLEEQLDLARAWLDNGDERARSNLVRAYQPMIRRIARKYLRNGLAMDDLVQEGTIGLLRAIDNFDPERELSLSNLARFHIAHRINTFIFDSAYVAKMPNSRRLKRLFYRVVLPIQQIESGLGVKLTRAQKSIICEDEDCTFEELEEFELMRSVPKSICAHSDDEESGFEPTDDAKTPEDALISSATVKKVSEGLHAAIAELDEQPRSIMARRHFSGEFVSYDTIAEENGISRERVRAIEKRAIEDIKPKMLSRGIRGVGDIFEDVQV